MSYRFGDFTLDAATRQLVVRDQEIHLAPKAFDLLHLLLANRSRAMSKSELQQQLWPTTFVEETNLAGLVAEIRRALRDPAATPRFVRTVYGFGYRFVGDVSLDAAPPGPPARSSASRTSRYLVFERRELMLMEGANVIGRAPDATIHIDSPGVSRYHAQIVVTSGSATLQDAGSKNGTYLNGTRLEAPAVLSDGQTIGIGSVILTFKLAPAMCPTETLHADQD